MKIWKRYLQIIVYKQFVMTHYSFASGKLHFNLRQLIHPDILHSKTTTWMGSSRMHPYPPERQLCGFIAEFLDGSSRKGSGWSQHVKQNPKIVIVCHFFRFAPFCEPALNKVTRMLNLLSSLFSKFLFSSHLYLSLSLCLSLLVGG